MRFFDQSFELNAEIASQLFTDIASRTKVHNIRKVDKPIIIFGAGNLGKLAFDYFHSINIKVYLILDNNPTLAKKDCFWDNHKISHPNSISKVDWENSLIAVCIVNVPFHEIKNQAKELGGKDIVPFYDICEAYLNKHPLGNGWFIKKFSDDTIKKINLVLKIWDDERSISHYLQMLAWRKLREEWIFEKAPIQTGNRFFIPEVTRKFTKNETFLDIGSHNGSVFERFLKETNSSFNKIILYEPDPQSSVDLEEKIQSLPLDIRNRIIRNQVAVGNINGRSKFFAEIDYASQLSVNGKSDVDVVKIDSQNLSPTIIKIHIEGHELNALRGAISCISSNRPILMVTIYHNSDAIYKLPLWFFESLRGYNLFLRLHSWLGNGAVIYAIPK